LTCAEQAIHGRGHRCRVSHSVAGATRGAVLEDRKPTFVDSLSNEWLGIGPRRWFSARAVRPGGRTDLIGRGMVRAARSSRAFPEQGPHVGDVVLGYRRREHCRALLLAGSAAAKAFNGRLRLPALKDVDTAGVEQVGGNGEVEAASCPARLFDDAHAAHEVGLALLGSTVMCPATMTMGALLFWRFRVVPVGNHATQVDIASSQNSSTVWST
jgi:hypothetical protein